MIITRRFRIEIEREAWLEFPTIDVRTSNKVSESQAAANADDYALRVLKCHNIKAVVRVPYDCKTTADHSIGPKK